MLGRRLSVRKDPKSRSEPLETCDLWAKPGPAAAEIIDQAARKRALRQRMPGAGVTSLVGVQHRREGAMRKAVRIAREHARPVHGQPHGLVPVARLEVHDHDESMPDRTKFCERRHCRVEGIGPDPLPSPPDAASGPVTHDPEDAFRRTDTTKGSHLLLRAPRFGMPGGPAWAHGGQMA